VKITKSKLKQIIKEELNEIGIAPGFESLDVPQEIYDIVEDIVERVAFAETANDAKEDAPFIARHLSKALNIEEAIIVNFINEYTPRKTNEDVIILMNVIAHNIAEYLEKNDFQNEKPAGGHDPEAFLDGIRQYIDELIKGVSLPPIITADGFKNTLMSLLGTPAYQKYFKGVDIRDPEEVNKAVKKAFDFLHATVDPNASSNDPRLREIKMKLTKSKLKQIIKEELNNLFHEGFGDSLYDIDGDRKHEIQRGVKDALEKIYGDWLWDDVEDQIWSIQAGNVAEYKTELKHILNTYGKEISHRGDVKLGDMVVK